MKSQILIFSLYLLVCSCENPKPGLSKYAESLKNYKPSEITVYTHGIRTDANILNLQGQPINSIKSGEQFILRYQIINERALPETLLISNSPISYKIEDGNHNVVSSVCANKQDSTFKRIILTQDSSFTIDWIAPNTPACNKNVILKPGLYSIIFSEKNAGYTKKVGQPIPVPFEVIK
jgi:hypothetical protein